MAAFRAALACGADGIETDLRLAQDGSLWLFHDDDFKRLAGRAGSVEVSGSRALYDLRLKGGARLAALDELLELLRKARRPDCVLNLELKGAKKYQLVLAAKIAAMDQAGEFRGLRVTVSSFNHAALRALRALRRQSPAIPVAPLWNGRGRFSPVLKTALALKAEAVHLAVRAVTVRRIEAIHKAGWVARVYTVNDPVVAKKFAALGVDAIFTDDPGAMRSSAWTAPP